MGRNKYYSKSELDDYTFWIKSIEGSNKLRESFRPQLFWGNSKNLITGYETECRICGGEIGCDFGHNMGIPLEEKFFRCPNSDDSGHGHWASIIRMMLN